MEALLTTITNTAMMNLLVDQGEKRRLIVACLTIDGEPVEERRGWKGGQ